MPKGTPTKTTKAIERLEAQNIALQEQLAGMALQLKARFEQEGGTEKALERVVLKDDPFDAQNPMRFTEQPPGKRLGWKNVDFRDQRIGWKGWTPVTWDSEIGKAVAEGKYLINPPARLKVSESDNNYVMRGADTVLAWITEELFDARMHNHTERTNARTKNAGRLNLPGQEGVQEIGSVTVSKGAPK